MSPASAAELLFGLKVDLIGNRRRCHSNIAVIRPSNEPSHAGELRCVVCNARIGYVSTTTGAWLATVIERFGAPGKPIIIRKKEAPAT
jgi:hypothetical protein